MSDLARYACIQTHHPREFCLLQGQGCRWAKCAYCDYHTDQSPDPFAVNEPVLAQVTGVYGVLDVINSGSCTELDESTLARIAKIVQDKAIHTLWFEAHYMYRDKFPALAARFAGVKVRFRTGIETFDGKQREAWHKGIPAHVTPTDVARHFDGICLLIGVAGQSREAISNDIETGLALFDYMSINAFVENSTPLRRDEATVEWFTTRWLPVLQDNPKVEILLHNTDLGVG